MNAATFRPAPRMLRPALLTVLLGPSALLLGALYFQHFLGLQPCEMCMWQRYALVAVLVAGLGGWMAGSRALTAVAAVSFLAVAALAGYHWGVEHHWWAGPSRCTGGHIDIFALHPVVQCDVPAWSFAGLSMAGWDMALSAALGAYALWSLRR